MLETLLAPGPRGYGPEDVSTELALEPKAESVRASRDLVRRTLGSVDCELAEVAAILTNEVVANAVGIAGHRSSQCRGRWGTCRDRSDRQRSGSPRPEGDRSHRESGRGLIILEAFSDDWGDSVGAGEAGVVRFHIACRAKQVRLTNVIDVKRWEQRRQSR